jgi:lauroyl/myristoyl acyltransferase
MPDTLRQYGATLVGFAMAIVSPERIAPTVRGFIDEDHLFAYREEEEGVPYIDVWRIELRNGE